MEEKNIKWYVYSIDPNIKISQLKKWEFNPNYNTQYIKNIMNQNNIDFIIQWESSYNFKFQSIVSKPYIVYYKWDLDLLNKKILAIVWPRLPSIYSTEILNELFNEIKWSNIATISWLAKWVDQICHNLSIENNIPTIAVLWWWLMNYLNSSDKYLIDKICANWWLILSEFRLDEEPTNYSFPQRNRIIAWLSDAIFLPQAGKKSWSLITVDFGIKMWKSIYGVPWNIWNQESFWLNQYIAEKKVSAVYDISLFVEEFIWTIKQAKIEYNLSENEQKLFDIISQNRSINIDYLIENSTFKVQEIMSILTNLELNNIIKQTLPWEYEIY